MARRVGHRAILNGRAQAAVPRRISASQRGGLLATGFTHSGGQTQLRGVCAGACVTACAALASGAAARRPQSAGLRAFAPAGPWLLPARRRARREPARRPRSHARHQAGARAQRAQGARAKRSTRGPRARHAALGGGSDPRGLRRQLRSPPAGSASGRRRPWHRQRARGAAAARYRRSARRACAPNWPGPLAPAARRRVRQARARVARKQRECSASAPHSSPSLTACAELASESAATATAAPLPTTTSAASVSAAAVTPPAVAAPLVAAAPPVAAPPAAPPWTAPAPFNPTTPRSPSSAAGSGMARSSLRTGAVRGRSRVADGRLLCGRVPAKRRANFAGGTRLQRVCAPALPPGLCCGGARLRAAPMKGSGGGPQGPPLPPEPQPWYAGWRSVHLSVAAATVLILLGSVVVRLDELAWRRHNVPERDYTTFLFPCEARARSWARQRATRRNSSSRRGSRGGAGRARAARAAKEPPAVLPRLTRLRRAAAPSGQVAARAGVLPAGAAHRRARGGCVPRGRGTARPQPPAVYHPAHATPCRPGGAPEHAGEAGAAHQHRAGRAAPLHPRLPVARARPNAPLLGPRRLRLRLPQRAAHARSPTHPLRRWNEALHGVAISAGVVFAAPTPSATSFPQVIGTAASFNASLWSAIGSAISTEARAFSNAGHAGLTFWCV